ncbi:MAG: diadenylate cyclase [Desulfobacterales bacterium]|nr:MAG: diadenylate cyclase [Desulfobacterales bacterium]
MSQLLAFFSNIRWQDVVDITLNSYILFRLYILFRGTNVFRVLIGIALLWFFQRIAVSMGLIVTSWAIQGITAVAALIIIVVFRNEIRSVLQARNLKAILWGFSDKTVNTPVEIIVESVYELARTRTGALIVFPGKEDLEEVVQGGTPWHGLVSQEMITSIFWHDNPVHDGAAIIKGNQVTEVGVILPLSHRDDLPSHYGTRHRAGAGLAETTDALVVVASEERGNVVLAKGSHMRVISRKEELARALREHVGVTAEEWTYLRKGKLEIGMAALASILFITGVWFSFTRGLDALVTLEIPIEYMNRDPEMQILDTSVNAVHLDLSGSGALIKSIRPGQVQVRLDLNKAAAGHNTFTITDENVALPPGVFLKRVKPSVVEVTVDVPVKKKLAVQVDWVGKLPEHLVITEAKLEPESIWVIGGKRILQNVSTIYTENVPLDNIRRTGEMTVGLKLDLASVKIAPGSTDRIKVAYLVKERI